MTQPVCPCDDSGMRVLHSLLWALPLVALVARPVWAEESAWNKAFTPDPVCSYLPAGKNDVLVATAGEIPASQATAPKALENAFRSCGRVGLVMDATSLGPVAGMDDARIVKRAGGMPVNRVSILRLFPAGPREPWRAVVTTYDKAGNVVGAFSATAGTPLEKSGGGGAVSPGEGLSARTADEVAGQVATYRATNTQAQESYDQSFIGFDDWAAITQTGQVVRTWTQPWQGKYRRPLEGADFYRALGRNDLAERYRSSRSTKIAITVLGVVVGTVGVVLLWDGIGKTPD